MHGRRNEDQKGQTIIIVAFIFLGLIIMAAIAVDVTGIYSERRTAQNAADAAALAAAQELGHYLRGESTTDGDVLYQLNDFAQRNGASRVTGYYLDENRAPLTEIGVDGFYIPDDALGVEATAYITASTFFGGAVGMDGYPLSAEAGVAFEKVCYGGECLLPISVFAGGFEGGPDNPDVVDFIVGQCYNLWDGKGGGNFGWLNWSNQAEDFSCKSAGLSSDCSAPCVVYNLDPSTCIDQPADMVRVGDLVGGEPGVMDANLVGKWLDYYIDNEIIARMMLYDFTEQIGGGTCGTTTWDGGVAKNQHGLFYKVAGFGAFRLTGYRLSHGVGKDPDTRDEIDPSTCLDYPGQDGLCCSQWEVCTGEYPYDNCEFYCPDENWHACDFRDGDVNRITGIFQPWTEETYETCDAVGNFLAPRLFK